MTATILEPTDGLAELDEPRPAPRRAATPSSAGAIPARERLRSLDVFRGLTVAGMLLVNNPGSAAAVYGPLRHSAWHGWTPADLIFPFFLFIVGITTHLSLSAREARGDGDSAIRRQIVRRAGLIFLVGLVLNWFPFYQSGAIAGHPSPDFLDRMAARLEHLRLLGVLQRIGLAYLAAALLAWKAPARRVAATAAALLVGYWAAMTLLPVPGQGAVGAALLDDRSRTLAAWVDRTTLDWTRWSLGNHIWDAGVTYDPEGLLSTIPAAATVLLGILAGRWIAAPRPLADRLRGLLAAAFAGITLGAVWGWWFPINKSLWTSSYVLLTAGMACAAIAAVVWLVDVRRWAAGRWSEPFAVYGTNPMVAFVGSAVMAKLVHSTFKLKLDGHRMGAEEALHHALVGAGMGARAASLAYALLFVGAWFAVLLALYRRRIVLRV
jgi:predicted acyltransferase